MRHHQQSTTHATSSTRRGPRARARARGHGRAGARGGSAGLRASARARPRRESARARPPPPPPPATAAPATAAPVSRPGFRENPETRAYPIRLVRTPAPVKCAPKPLGHLVHHVRRVPGAPTAASRPRHAACYPRRWELLPNPSALGRRAQGSSRGRPFDGVPPLAGVDREGPAAPAVSARVRILQQ